MSLKYTKIHFIRGNKEDVEEEVVASLSIEPEHKTLLYTDHKLTRMVKIFNTTLAVQNVFNRLCEKMNLNKVQSLVLRGYDMFSTIDNTLVTIRLEGERKYITVYTSEIELTNHFDNMIFMFDTDSEEVTQQSIRKITATEFKGIISETYILGISHYNAYLMLECIEYYGYEIGLCDATLFIRERNKNDDVIENKWISICMIELLDKLIKWASDFKFKSYNSDWVSIVIEASAIKDQIIKGGINGEDNEIPERESSTKTS